MSPATRQIGNRSNGHHFPIVITNVDAANIAYLIAMGLPGLNSDLPRAPEQVHIADMITAQRGLHRPKQRIHIDAKDLQPVAIKIEMQLRCGGRKGGIDPLCSRITNGRNHHATRGCT